MRLADLATSLLTGAIEHTRLIVSVQAGEGSPLENTDALVRSARASLQEGVKIFRAEGVRNVSAIKKATGAIMIGLVKRKYEDSEVYITPTMREVRELLDTDCEAIALDATARQRPGAESLADLVAAIHAAGRLVVADIDSVEAAEEAYRLGADVIGTTLSGYTGGPVPSAPDIGLVRQCAARMRRLRQDLVEGDSKDLLAQVMTGGFETAFRNWVLSVPHTFIVAEGRFTEKWEVEAALRAGATAVVIGGAINDPVKNTRRLMPSSPPKRSRVAAIDIGGTWLRAAEFTGFERRGTVRKVALPPTRKEKMEWIAKFLKKGQFERVGISTGGVVKDNVVTISKPTLPENVGTDFNDLRQFLVGTDPVGVIALDDGHASAWAHACHPDYAGLNVATLAIGTGVGFGFVRQGKIFIGPGGEYTRINDLECPGGRTYEQLLGGAALTPKPTAEQKADANAAVRQALRMVTTFLFPDVIVLCGTVGMQAWLDVSLPPKEGFPEVPIVRSPFGAEAGIHGAAAVALYPPGYG